MSRDACTSFFVLPDRRLRILVLCGNDRIPITMANVYAELLQEHDIRFIEEKVLSFRRIALFSLRRIKRLGLASLIGSYLFYLRKCIAKEQKTPKRYSPVLVSDNLSTDPYVRHHIDEFCPDLILIGFCGLLSWNFLEKAGSRPVINIHPGITPRYRGFGNIWAFYEDNAACAGYTIHQVDAGTDTGKRIEIGRLDFNGVDFDSIDVYAAAFAARRLALLILRQERPCIPECFANLPSACYGVPTLTVYRKARRNYERLFTRKR